MLREALGQPWGAVWQILRRRKRKRSEILQFSTAFVARWGNHADQFTTSAKKMPAGVLPGAGGKFNWWARGRRAKRLSSVTGSEARKRARRVHRSKSTSAGGPRGSQPSCKIYKPLGG